MSPILELRPTSMNVINNELKDQPYCLLLDEGSINYSRKWLAILIRHLVDGKVVAEVLCEASERGA